MLREKTSADILQVLRLHPLFMAMPAGWEATLGGIERVSFAPGETVATGGQPAAFLHVVVEGHCKIFVAVGDRPEGIIDILDAGGVFGETAVTGIGRYTASAVALDALTMVRVPGAEIRAFLEAHPKVVMGMMATMAQSLRGLLNQVTELKLKTTAQRLAMYLIELAGRQRPGDLGPTVVDLPFTKRIVAMKLGMTPETLSRAMAKLEPHGVHAGGRNQVHLDDPEALSAFCGFWPDDDGGVE
jgi:CRP-like cAMP-binding protein